MICKLGMLKRDQDFVETRNKTLICFSGSFRSFEWVAANYRLQS